MNSINYIEISISNITNQIDIAIDVKHNIYFTKNGKYSITNEKIEELLSIIRTWNNEYDASNMIDSEKFLICIKSREKEEIIKSHGNLPINYDQFKNWVGDLNA